MFWCIPKKTIVSQTFKRRKLQGFEINRRNEKIERDKNVWNFKVQKYFLLIIKKRNKIIGGLNLAIHACLMCLIEKGRADLRI